MADDNNIDVKKEVYNLRKKVRDFTNYVDYNTISYNDLVPFVLKIAKKFDKRLDDIEARLDVIENILTPSPV